MPLFSSLIDFLLLSEQAGGGGSFGGGGGGGGGGGDGGFVWLFVRVIIYLISFAIEDPLLGVPLLIFVAFVVSWLWKQGVFETKKHTIRKHRKARRSVRSVQAAEVLQETDPEFCEAAFIKRVEAAFIKTQDAWCAQDLAPIATFVSDGIRERFSLQIEEQQLAGWRQGMLDTTIRSTRIVDVCIGERYDSLTVRISFAANIHRVDLDSDKRIRGSELERLTFSEAWTFIRGHGTKTLNSDGLMEGQCPNCGAELVMRQSARCDHCDCHAKSGQFDWILAEITQWYEWSPESEESIPGLQAYREHDPALHPQVMEDLASVVFWRMTAADRRGSTDPLRGHTTEAFIKMQAGRMQAPAEGELRRYIADCAVGSVRTIGLLAGPEHDRAVVEIVWDGRRASQSSAGAVELKKERTRRTKQFLFLRQSGALTDHSDAFSTAHCRECGAHDDGDGAPTCRYCDAPRSADPTLWLLDDIVSHGTAPGVVLHAELTRLRNNEPQQHPLQPRNASAISLLHWAVALVHADGIVDRSERAKIHAMAARAGLTTLEAEDLLKPNPKQNDHPLPEDETTARAWLEQLTTLSLEDGKVSRRELRFLQRAAKTLGIPKAEHRALLRSVLQAYFQESKTAQRRWKTLAKQERTTGIPLFRP